MPYLVQDVRQYIDPEQRINLLYRRPRGHGVNRERDQGHNCRPRRRRLRGPDQRLVRRPAAARAHPRSRGLRRDVAGARTGVISRRWRGLWTRVPVLFFDNWPELESAGDVGLYVAFVNGVLAQRAQSTVGIDCLWIPLFMNKDSLQGQQEELVVPPSMEAAEAWIRYAVQKQVKDFHFKLCLPLPPPRTRIRTASTAPGSAGHLARIVSSACCPRLRNLYMRNVSFKRAETAELVIDDGELSELSLDYLTGLESLELRTPKLLDLKIETCDDLRAFRFSAPALEKLTFYYNRPWVAIHSDGFLPCAWFLRINLVTHLYDDSYINDSLIALLQRCSSSARSLLVHLEVPSEIERRVDLIKDKILQLPDVTDLAVNLHPIVARHSIGDGVVGLLTRFSNLEYLRLQLEDVPGCIKRDGYYSGDADVESAFICKHADNWASTGISLANLREAEFEGLTGTGCECRFLRFVLASATDLQTVTVRFSVNEYTLEGRKDGFLRRLIVIGDGTWTTYGEDPHQWYE